LTKTSLVLPGFWRSSIEPLSGTPSMFFLQIRVLYFCAPDLFDLQVVLRLFQIVHRDNI
jgi:hypothetical protein